MAKINLLPWREKLRQQKKKEFIESSAFAAVVGGVIVFVWATLIGIQIDHQQARNDRLTAEIAKLDKEIEEVKSLQQKKEVLLSRMKIISGLQANRPYIVHLFDQLVRTLPEGVYYKSVTRTGNKISISGLADSNESVSALMRKLDASKWFKDPLLTGVTSQKITIPVKEKGSSAQQQTMSAFNLTVTEESPPQSPNASAAPK